MKKAMDIDSFFKNIEPAIKKNRRALIGIAAICVLSALLAVKGFHSRHLIKKAEIEARAETYRKTSAAVLREDEAGKLKISADKKIAELEKGLLNADSPSIGAALLQEAFKSYTVKKGIAVSSERALPFNEKDGYKKIPVEFQFKANPEELKGLLYDIKSSPLIMGVRSLRLKSSGRGGPERLNVSLVLEGVIRSRP